MYDATATSPAEQILGMGNEAEVFGMMSDLARKRQLSTIVKQLNVAVLDGEGDERSLAIAALSRMGLWQD